MESIDYVWVLFCTVLVLNMQTAFCCLEVGLVRSKNSVNVVVKNLFDFCVVVLVFTVIGFYLITGLSPIDLLLGHASAKEVVSFVFQLAFCATSASIISGAVAERTRLYAYALIVFVVTAVIYPIFASSVWGVNESGVRGWLANIGFIDYAGSTVVHSIGGWVALAAVLVIGPRLGRFDEKKPIEGHNIPLAVVGVFFFFIGWIGFNGGIENSFTENVPFIVLNTIIAGTSGGVAALLVSHLVFGRINVRYLIGSVIGGLVAITAGVHVFVPLTSIVVGGISSLVLLVGIVVLEKLRIDDAVDAIPMHLCCGIWGTLAVPIFADTTLLNTGLNTFSQILVQFSGIIIAGLWAFVPTYFLFKLLNMLIPFRVSEADEKLGLNIAEHESTTELIDLLHEMEKHAIHGEFDKKLSVEPHTEIGQIAQQYNRVLEKVNAEANRATENQLKSDKAKLEAQLSRDAMETQISELQEFNRHAINREVKMRKLKILVNDLCQKLGEPPQFDISS